VGGNARRHRFHPAHGQDPHTPEQGGAQLFTGSLEAVERSRAFSGPGEEVFEDRDKHLAARN
jgi:hypothetical protein